MKIIDVDTMADVRSLSGQFYLKSETDKIIAHQKYKRCMAMAEACRHKRWRGGIGEEGYDYARATRHMNVWLELADKLKETK